MNQVYVIADTHFYHEKLTKVRGFYDAEQMNNVLIHLWNKTVDKKDTVWILGDVVFGGSKNIHILGKLNGYKKLILGNHDRYPSNKYLQYVNSLHGSIQIDNCILTHIPVHPNQLHRYKGNIHGHLHSNELADERYICVSVEQLTYTPTLLNKLTKRLNEPNLIP